MTWLKASAFRKADFVLSAVLFCRILLSLSIVVIRDVLNSAETGFELTDLPENIFIPDLWKPKLKCSTSLVCDVLIIVMTDEHQSCACALPVQDWFVDMYYFSVF